jgi:hypothetical protein
MVSGERRGAPRSRYRGLDVIFPVRPWLLPQLRADNPFRPAANTPRLRAERGLSQEALAHECGINRTYLSGVERSKRSRGRRRLRFGFRRPSAGAYQP